VSKVILALETSCDETAAAVCSVEGRILSSKLHSQIPIHRQYGGIVPEVASRSHVTRVRPLVEAVLEEAGVELSAVEAYAATCGPGLVSSLLIGTSMAKALAVAEHKPFLAVNHMEAHLLSPFVEGGRVVPALGLIVSGGHTMLVQIHEVGRYSLLGRTRDDAAGECLDKVARMLGLPYPGGPEIDRLVREKGGDAKAFDLPRSRLTDSPLDFSFSGLKTAVLYTLPKVDVSHEQTLANLCASVQEAVVDVLVEKTLLAARQTGQKIIAISGGVSCNSRLRTKMRAACDGAGLQLLLAAPHLCTDNAGMVAFAAAQRHALGQRSPLTQEVDPHWRIDAQLGTEHSMR
jgi:N6-L-threonylcarbamoyladenine synthase